MKALLRIREIRMVCLWVIFLTACSKNDEMSPAKQDGFELGSFETAGIDQRDIIGLENEITEGHYNIHSILILKSDKLIYEKYFSGEDAIFPAPVGVIEHNRETLHDCRSLTKSIV